MEHSGARPKMRSMELSMSYIHPLENVSRETFALIRHYQSSFVKIPP